MAVTQTSDNANLLTQVAGTLNYYEINGILTDAMVNASATRAALKTAIDNAPVHNDQVNHKIVLKRAIDVSGLSDSDVNSAATVAALFTALGVSSPSLATLE